MNSPWPDLDCQALRAPLSLSGLQAWQWDKVLQQLRRANVVGRVAAQLDEAGMLGQVPAGPREHLQGELKLVRAQHQQVRREVQHILACLSGLSIPVVLLKGAAYVLAESPAAVGRLSSDVDILVPRSALSDVEGNLMLAGWNGVKPDDYDQRYYREWMHELPPMQHMHRGTSLDVHHNILPLTVRRPPDAGLLLAAIRPLAAWPGAFVFQGTDMLLHSITHLLHNDELSHSMRDLSDIDLMLRAQAAEPAFWPRLLARAAALHLSRTLYYGLWSANQALDSPVPDDVWAELQTAKPAWPLRKAMHALWRRGLCTVDPQAPLDGSGAAQFMLYVRAHWLRMPPLLLTQHLSRKAWKRLKAKPQALP